ncbi:hypothetical protein B0T26DRAFT_654355 [Lasiosphaeria miniovina]|uniref:Uncharacterized protein n=1 Tax=Lasiosphaeria miniovina TaxID=1954250 RepID=A0AA40DQD7_9PEZI|nr:uncharacterized protein B0T26DRAFT_654355 [Lasiosphaeria miniovina]KAK0709402.1 hypothetical protein B0T26DRAFT_654355 [Lasiosphaeria miniovina]
MEETCKACNEPLILNIDAEASESGDEEAQPHQQEEEKEIVEDDLELPCGCHFHWQCLMDSAPQVALSLKCPSCDGFLPSNAPGSSSATNAFRRASQAVTILTRYVNEGGVEDGLDILPALTEEAFLAEHPEARPARALHTMAAEGDVVGIVSLVKDVDADSAQSDAVVGASVVRLLAWSDPLNENRSALHIAVEAQQVEVFWLLMWLASGLPTAVFPQGAAQAADGLGVASVRPGLQVPRAEDVRFVKDGMGRSVLDVCLAQGSPWTRFVEDGVFDQ